MLGSSFGMRLSAVEFRLSGSNREARNVSALLFNSKSELLINCSSSAGCMFSGLTEQNSLENSMNSLDSRKEMINFRF